MANKRNETASKADLILQKVWERISKFNESQTTSSLTLPCVFPLVGLGQLTISKRDFLRLATVDWARKVVSIGSGPLALKIDANGEFAAIASTGDGELRQAA